MNRCLLALIMLSFFAPFAHANPLSEAEKQAILDLHNATRSDLASGLITDDGTDGTYPAASNMTEMVWNDILESVAQGWADQCTFGVNSNRSIEWLTAGGDPSITYIGENDAFSSTSGPVSLITVEGLYGLWATQNGLWHYQTFSTSTINGAGHFTQLVWADSMQVGCAAASCPSINPPFNSRLLVCNYAPGGNFSGQTPYQLGTPASSCPEGYEPGGGSLCVVATPALVPSLGGPGTVSAILLLAATALHGLRRASIA